MYIYILSLVPLFLSLIFCSPLSSFFSELRRVSAAAAAFAHFSGLTLVACNFADKLDLSSAMYFLSRERERKSGSDDAYRAVYLRGRRDFCVRGSKYESSSSKYKSSFKNR